MKAKILMTLVVGVLFSISLASAEICWSEGGWSSGTIYRSKPDGSGKEQLFTSGTRALTALALETSEGKLYWIGRDKIQRSNLDGTNVEDLITGTFFSEGLALDTDNGKMYWTDYNGNIQRANFDGSNIELLHSRPGNTYGLAIDISRQKMYWSERGSGFENDIRCSELIGTNPEYLLDGGTEPLGIALDTKNEMIYWADWIGQNVWRAYMDGTNPEVIYTSLGNPISVTIDSLNGKVYWSEWGTHNIMRANLDGSDSELLFTTDLNPWGIVVVPEPCHYTLAGDHDSNCKVDLSDVSELSSGWQISYDINTLRTMAVSWLIDCNINPSDPACVPICNDDGICDPWESAGGGVCDDCI